MGGAMRAIPRNVASFRLWVLEKDAIRKVVPRPDALFFRSEPPIIRRFRDLPDYSHDLASVQGFSCHQTSCLNPFQPVTGCSM